MYKVGVVPGKFFPPHRGHLAQIIQAATKCEKVYVVVSDNEALSREKCLEDGIPFISLHMRTLWMSIELKDFENIHVLTIDEKDIPPYPHGSEQWSRLLIENVPEEINAIFGGEEEYRHTYMTYFTKGIVYEVFDYARSQYPISGTEIRSNYLEYWDYMLGCARSFFTRRVLITGTESCGKTTMTRYLAKIFHTSWSEEYGRHYSKEFLGGNESLFTTGDFGKIAFLQHEQDLKAMRTANKVCFFDSDAVVTEFYCDMYTGAIDPNIRQFINPDKYDVVMMFSPSVKWVEDGLRFNSEQKERERLHDILLDMYINYGFEKKIIVVEDQSYTDRLKEAIDITNRLIAFPKFMPR